jgi:hypothetical protein
MVFQYRAGAAAASHAALYGGGDHPLDRRESRFGYRPAHTDTSLRPHSHEAEAVQRLVDFLFALEAAAAPDAAGGRGSFTRLTFRDVERCAVRGEGDDLLESLVLEALRRAWPVPVGLIERSGREGRSLLHHVAELGFTHVLALLMEAATPPRINCADDSGLTPLHIAARAGDGLMISALLSYGADDTVADKNGRTASDMAGHLFRGAAPEDAAGEESKSEEHLAHHMAAMAASATGAGAMGSSAMGTSGPSNGGRAAGREAVAATAASGSHDATDDAAERLAALTLGEIGISSHMLGHEVGAGAWSHRAWWLNALRRCRTRRSTTTYS